MTQNSAPSGFVTALVSFHGSAPVEALVPADHADDASVQPLITPESLKTLCPGGPADVFYLPGRALVVRDCIVTGHGTATHLHGHDGLLYDFRGSTVQFERHKEAA